MATKSILYNKNILFKHLKEKKHWALLTTLVLIITVLVLPMLLETEIREEVIAIGIVEVFIVVIVNCLIDFNYLHDHKKFSYYTSKPMNAFQRLHMVMISNVLFASFFMAILMVVAGLNGIDIETMFVSSYPWLLVFIFLTGLSSYLTGNTIIAGLSTVFNFLLPLIVVGILQFAVSLVADMSHPYNVQMVMDYIMEHIYKLDVIYFIKYVDQGIDIFYFVYLIGLLTGIYLLTRHFIKKRKNENIGEFVVFKGYENFVAMIFSLLVPFIFTSIMPSNNFVLKLIAFVILGSLTYYIATIILEKSFKISKLSYKVFAVFMSLFILTVIGIGSFLTYFNDQVPAIDDIDQVLITNTSWFFSESKERGTDIQEINRDNYQEYNVNAFETDQALEGIQKIHQGILKGATSQFSENINIIYFMKDGSEIRRYFTLRGHDGDSNSFLFKEGIDQWMTSQEYKEKHMPFVFDDAYAESFENELLRVNYENEDHNFILEAEVLQDLREALAKDINMSLEDIGYDNLWHIFSPNNYMLASGDKPTVEATGIWLNISNNQNKEVSFDVLDQYHNTRALIQRLIENK